MKYNLEIIKLRFKLTIMIVLMSVLLMPSLSSAALEEFYSATGKIFTSVDGAGSNDDAGHSIDVEKPSAGATVRRAFLMESSQGAVINDGDVQLDGNPINWDDCSVPLPFGSLNSCLADVTAFVKPIMDVEAVGVHSFTLTETSRFNVNVDGEVLVVVFDDPTETIDQTIILLHGFQSTTGDDFAITFADPIDSSDPVALADMGLGIGFGSQGFMFSEINVNGIRLTSAAGGQDDGGSFNGGLITVGGLGDSNINPIDPSQEPNGDPRLDDELYTILPFLTPTDTSVDISTLNPSNDDIIFFAYFNLSTAAIVDEGIVLSPLTATNPVGTDHMVTATVVDNNGDPVADQDVAFNVIAGPNSGKTGTGTSDVQGEAVFTYTDMAGPGTDQIQASFLNPNSAGNPEMSNVVEKIWRGVDELVLSPNTATNPVGTDHTVTAVVVDENGSPIAVAGREVTFNVIAGPNSGNTGTGTTDPQGDAVFTYTDTAGPGTDQILASFLNSAGETALSNTVEKIWLAESILLSPLTAINPIGTDHTVTAMVVDDNRDPIADREVTFNIIAGPNSDRTGTGTTDAAQGEAIFTYTDNAGPGTDQIQASFLNSVGLTVESAIVEKIWRGPNEFSLFPVTAMNPLGTNHTVTAVVTDDNGNPVQDLEVTFTVISGPNVDNTGIGTTNDQGEAEFTYTDMVGPGTDQIQASFLNASGLTDLSTIVEKIWRGPDGIVLSPDTATNQVGTDHTVTAMLTDDNSNPIAGRDVTFTVITGPNSGSTGTGTTDPQGDAIFTYTDSAGPGTDQILASFLDFAGELVVSMMVETIWLGSDEIVLSPVTAANLVKTDHTVTARVVDGNGDPIIGREVTFMIVAGPNSGRTEMVITDDVQGEATFTYTDTEGPGTDQIQASFLNLSGEIVVSDMVESIWVGSGILLSPDTATNLASTTHTVTALVLDDSGNPIPGREITFTVIAGPNNGQTGAETTDAQGKAIFTYTDSAGPGIDQIQASSLTPAGNTELSEIVDNRWRGPDGIVLSPDTDNNLVGTDHTVTAMLIDDNRNPIAGREVTFTVISGPNSGNTGTGITDAQGEAIYTYTDSAGPGTDQIQASFLNFADEIVVSTIVESIWEFILGPERIELSPVTATSLVGTNHTVTAIVVDDNDNPIADRELTFTIITGPNTGITGTGITNTQGESVFTYTDTAGPGTDQIQASFLFPNSQGVASSNIVEKIWEPNDVSVVESIVLSPDTATNPVGTTHTVTARVGDDNDNPIVGRVVTFTVLAGPNTGNTGTETSNTQGEVLFTYTDTAGPGTDQIQASFLNSAGDAVASNSVVNIWEIVSPTRCDVNGDLVINQADIQAIFDDRNRPASGSNDPRDVDGDLTITVNDARVCVLQCTLPACE